jgi:hypothetical protein
MNRAFWARNSLRAQLLVGSCMRATASQQARIFCPENLCSALPPCFAFVGSHSSRKAHDRSTAGGRPGVPCGPSRTSPPPLPTFRKIHVDSAALTHQPFLDLRPFCTQLFSTEDNTCKQRRNNVKIVGSNPGDNRQRLSTRTLGEPSGQATDRKILRRDVPIG